MGRGGNVDNSSTEWTVFPGSCAVIGLPARRSLAEPEDAGAYLELLLPSYKALPEDCIQKAR